MKNEFDLNLSQNENASFEEEQENFRALFELTPRGVIYLNRSGKIIAANAAAQQILGLTLDQMQFRAPFDPRWHVIHPDGSDFPFHSFPGAVAVKTGTTLNHVVMGVYIPADEQYRWINVNAVPLFRPGEDRPYQSFAVFEDITERKRVEDALRESEERYRQLFEMESDALFLIDNEEGKILDANLAAANLYGYSHEELLQMRNVDLSAEPDETRRITRTGVSAVPLRYHRKKDGTVFPVEITATFLTLSGRPVHIPAIRDITRRVQIEDALRESEAVMHYIIKYDPNAIAVYDLDLHYIAVSDRYLRDYEVKEQDLIGKHHYQVFPEMPQKWKEVHQRVLKGAIERNEDDYFVRSDGTITYNSWECRPWYQADGAIGGMITYTEVTTKRKQAELQLNEQLEELRRWQTVTLGREMRILDLKREINDLLIAAGQPPRYVIAENIPYE